MGITAYEVFVDTVLLDGGQQVRYQYTWDTGKVLVYGPKVVPSGFDTAADATSIIPLMESNAAWDEVNTQKDLTSEGGNPDKVPAEYQDQNDFDRRLLGLMMQETDAHAFNASYPFFQAVEARGGANANQRATYLGVTSVEYGQVEDRYNNVSGVSWFLTDEKNQIWEEIPSEDWL